MTGQNRADVSMWGLTPAVAALHRAGMEPPAQVQPERRAQKPRGRQEPRLEGWLP